MAKLSMIRREEKRTRLKDRDAEKRNAFKAVLADPEADFDAKIEARDKLNKLPRDGAEIRQQNRCQFCGRPHGYHRTFGICRIHLREMAAAGLLPGVRKGSW